VVAAEVSSDGRRQRRIQNRDAVIDALVAMIDEGHYQPSAAEIATRAGISPRSLFRYFEDTDDLSRAAVERHFESAGPLFDLDVDASASTEVKIAAVVDARLRLFDAIAPGARVARIVSWRNTVVAERLRDTRAHLRRQVERAFAPELGDRPEVLDAVDVLLSFESRDLLRDSRRRTALVAALTALLRGDR
jgi:TetR/AcrR family transcriptional regulator of autoinduction and epiphytic fitness